MNKLLSVAVLASALCGCVATGPGFTRASPAPEGSALVYLYRPNNFVFSARKAKFYVDSVHVADLNAKGYTWLHVPQGTHTLTQRWPIDTLTQTIGGPIRFVAGRTYFFRLTSGSNYAEMYWQLAEQPWNTAAAEIEECRYQKAKTGKRG